MIAAHRTLDPHLAAHDAQRQAQTHAEMVRRVRLATTCHEDPLAQAVTREVCRRDVAVFFSDWLWTYDPRNVSRGLPTDVPFTLRPRQVDFLAWLEEGERIRSGGLVEKSRDEGASFLFLGYLLHRWLFVPGFAGAVGSRKEELVDKIGDPKTLFWKLRFMLYRLPAWLLPEGFSRKEHDNFLRLFNPATGASIAGEAGDNMGRGGRASVYFVDEWAHVERAEAVNAAVSQNSEIRVKVFTPNGVGGVAYQERFSGKHRVFTFHWRDNPDKNFQATREDGTAYHPWYEKQVAELDPVTLAQEVDIDYTSSAENVVIPAAWVQSALKIRLASGAVRRSALDVSEDGADKTVYAHRRGGLVTRVVEIRDATPAAKARQAEALALEDDPQVFQYDRLGVGAAVTATVKEREASLPFKVTGLANSEAPSAARLEDQPDVPADERFANAAAEWWWALRIRFWKTHLRVTGERYSPDDECIQLPESAALVAQMSQPTYAKTNTGKLKVDKRGNGTASPDHAEAVLYAFAEPPHAPATPRPRFRFS